MYHSISPENSPASSPYYQTNTRPEVFRAHMEHLATNGYEVVPLQDLVCRTGQDAPPTGNRVAITFDDGYRDFYEHAFPVLNGHGFPSTLFVPTGFVAKSFKGRRCLDWHEIRYLSGHGVSIGSHTVNHPKLHGMTKGAIEKEVFLSILEIEQRLGEDVSSFAYPYAFPQEDRRFVAMLEGILTNAGVKAGVTTRIGHHDASGSRLAARRIPANDHDDPTFFHAKLSGSYGWLAPIQYLKRRMSHAAHSGTPVFEGE